jgi:hypothetical protein
VAAPCTGDVRGLQAIWPPLPTGRRCTRSHRKAGANISCKRECEPTGVRKTGTGPARACRSPQFMRPTMHSERHSGDRICRRDFEARAAEKRASGAIHANRGDTCLYPRRPQPDQAPRSSTRFLSSCWGAVPAKAWVAARIRVTPSTDGNRPQRRRLLPHLEQDTNGAETMSLFLLWTALERAWRNL